MASGSEDKSVKLWNIVSGHCISTLKGHEDIVSGHCISTLKGHEGSVLSICSLDPESLVTGSSDKTIRKWNIKTGECVVFDHEHRDSIRAMCLLGDGCLVSGSRDGDIKVWNPEGSSLKATFVNGQQSDGGDKGVEPVKLVDVEDKVLYEEAREVARRLKRAVTYYQLRTIGIIRSPRLNRKGVYEIVIGVNSDSDTDPDRAVLREEFNKLQISKNVVITFFHPKNRKLQYAAGNIGEEIFAHNLSGSVGLVVTRKISKDSPFAEVFKNELRWKSGEQNPRLALITAAHVCTFPSIRFANEEGARYYSEHNLIAGWCSQDYAVVDIDPFQSPLENPQNLNTITGERFYTSSGNFADTICLTGVIRKVTNQFGRDWVDDFERDYCDRKRKRKVFFIGQRSKKCGYVSGVSHNIKSCIIECSDMSLQEGDSGGLLFSQETDHAGCESLVALGILSMMDVNCNVAYFTSLSLCLDHRLFDLP